ncbi:hypothetical protein GCM10017687_46240 [Streptomyces echinatus]
MASIGATRGRGTAVTAEGLDRHRRPHAPFTPGSPERARAPGRARAASGDRLGRRLGGGRNRNRAGRAVPGEERGRQEGEDRRALPPRAGWSEVATGLADAIVGLWPAPAGQARVGPGR